MKLNKAIKLIPIVGMVLLMVHCKKTDISQFEANPSTIKTGDYSTLTWSVDGTTSCSIKPTVGPVSSSGTQQVRPFDTTIYTLTAGSISESVQVTVIYDSTYIVYVTNNGEKYHLAGCQYLSQSQIPIQLGDACKIYSRCSVCNPPACK